MGELKLIRSHILEVNRNVGNQRPLDPLFQKDGLWYFWDETWGHYLGPYESHGSADAALTRYTKYLNKVDQLEHIDQMPSGGHCRVAPDLGIYDTDRVNSWHLLAVVLSAGLLSVLVGGTLLYLVVRTMKWAAQVSGAL